MPTFFPAARSIPLIRATIPPLLTLALLVLRVLADHHDCTVALHNLALSTDLLYRRSHFHRSLLLSTLRQLQSIGDTCFRKVIGRYLKPYLISWQDLDEVEPHLSADVSQHNLAVAQFHAEHRPWERFHYDALCLYDFFLVHNCVRMTGPWAVTCLLYTSP